jgi:hypothetical protein
MQYYSIFPLFATISLIGFPFSSEVINTLSWFGNHFSPDRFELFSEALARGSFFGKVGLSVGFCSAATHTLSSIKRMPEKASLPLIN